MNEVVLNGKELECMANALMAVKFFSHNDLKDVVIAKTAYTSGFDVLLESDTEPQRICLMLNEKPLMYYVPSWTDFGLGGD